MRLQAKVGNAAAGAWDFTVFRAVPKPFYKTDQTSENIPEEALSFGGTGGQDKLSMRKFFLTISPIDKFGLQVRNGPSVQGTMYIMWRIEPEGLDRNDFNRKGQATAGFFGRRVVSDRYWVNNTLPFNEADFSHNYEDNKTNETRDNIADPDLSNPTKGKDVNLYLHTIDRVNRDIGARIMRQEIKANDVIRYRFNANEYFDYNGVKCSPSQLWHFAFSGQIVKKDNAFEYKQLDGLKGDNEVAEGLVFLTPEMTPVKAAAPIITKIDQPPGGTLEIDPNKVVEHKLKIIGKNFTVPGANLPEPRLIVIRFAYEADRIVPTIRFVADLKVVSDTEITGKVNVFDFDPPGNYQIQFFRQDGAVAVYDSLKYVKK
jgi:hypothetical protein